MSNSQKKKKKKKTQTLVGSEYNIPTKCACCKKCWMRKKDGRCLYGGPFIGYYKIGDIK